MVRIRTIVVVGTVLALFATGCGILAGQPGTMTDLPEGVETAVKQAVSAQTNVDVEEIEILEAEEQEWPNACLGLAEEGEVCAEVITPGWEVRVEAGGEEYVYRTDEEGTTIRREE